MVGRLFPASASNILLAACLASAARAQGMPQRLNVFLSGTAGFSRGDIARVTSGTVIVKVLRASDRREVPLVGAMRVDVPRAVYVERATVTRRSASDSSPHRFGLFSDPAVLADVAGFTLPHSDVEELASCRPGSCELKLPGSEIVALRGMVDPASPSADSLVSAYLGQRMVDYVNAYRSRGNAALVVYADQRTPAPAVQIWDAMLAQSPYVYATVPELARYLTDYPADRPPGAQDVIFWTKSDLPGAKPMLTITDQVTYDPPALPGTTVIASKQLFCDHYLDGAFDLMVAIDAIPSAAAREPAVYVLFVRRLHFDDLPGGGIFNIRGRVIDKFRDETRDVLQATKRAAEHALASAH